MAEASATAFAALINKFEDEPVKQEHLINKVKKDYREGNFKKRQLFLIMAASIMNDRGLKKIFDQHFKEETVSLAYDSVPNVRIALARVLRQHFKMPNGLYIDDKQFNQVIQHLTQDPDEDVKNIISTINQGIVEDSSEVSSHVSNKNQQDDDKASEDTPIGEAVQKKYDGDHSDLALSSQGEGSQIAKEEEDIVEEEEFKEPQEELKAENADVEQEEKQEPAEQKA